MAENKIVSEKKEKAAFDEQTLARVLEAAYVLQEHNRERRQQQERETALRNSAPANSAKEPALSPSSLPPIAAVKTVPSGMPPKPAAPPDFRAVLGQIVETQQQIQAEHLDLEHAMAVIAERAMQVAQAGGASVGILENGKVRYRAAAGSMALAIGSEVLMEKALCSACLRIGQVIRCGSVNLEFLVDAEECARRGIESLIAAPVYDAGSVAGALELYYASPQSFTEPDVHACQLMAGLAGEVLARTEGQASKKSLAAERAAMRNALEKLKPNLEALVEPPRPDGFAARQNLAAAVAPPGGAAGNGADLCGKCGHELVSDEQFCGKCGMPRHRESEAPTMQSKVALLWQMQEEKNKNARNPGNGASHPHGSAGAFETFTPEDLSETAGPELPNLFTLSASGKQLAVELRRRAETAKALMPQVQPANVESSSNHDETRSEENPAPGASTSTAIVPTMPRPNWTSAAAALEFLERVARENRNNAFFRFLKVRRGDVYLALAIILVACVIRWGIWSDRPATNPSAPAATSHHSVYTDLSLFDKMLIKLGLADPPDAPVSKGNPNTQVWVDEQTALYYCPGADLYGKTAKGRITSQRDAQLDQIEPASRKACD